VGCSPPVGIKVWVSANVSGVMFPSRGACKSWLGYTTSPSTQLVEVICFTGDWFLLFHPPSRRKILPALTHHPCSVYAKVIEVPLLVSLSPCSAASSKGVILCGCCAL